MTTDTEIRSGVSELPANAARYDDDLYGWVKNQMALLRARQFEQIDTAHITDELVEMGRKELRKLISELRVLLLHMLKWDHQPDRRSRSWEITIAEHRDQIEYELRDSPSLKPLVGEATLEAYRYARRAAARETGLPQKTFPEICTYSWSDITHRPISSGDEPPDGDEDRSG